MSRADPDPHVIYRGIPNDLNPQDGQPLVKPDPEPRPTETRTGEGPGLIEYCLVGALIACVAIAALYALTKEVEHTFDEIAKISVIEPVAVTTECSIISATTTDKHVTVQLDTSNLEAPWTVEFNNGTTLIAANTTQIADPGVFMLSPQPDTIVSSDTDAEPPSFRSQRAIPENLGENVWPVGCAAEPQEQPG